MQSSSGISRRRFLEGAAVGAATLLLDLHNLKPAFADGRMPPGAREYRNYRDVYRKKWSWDRVGVGTHSCNNCASGGCSWNLYVRGGIVWREEQAAPVALVDPDHGRIGRHAVDHERIGRQGERDQVSHAKRDARVCLDNLVGRVDAAHRGIAHDALR